MRDPEYSPSSTSILSLMQSLNGEQKKEDARAFYKEALLILDEIGADYMLGGGFALYHYTGIVRDTKDLDIFCRSSDYTRILKYFSEKGYEIQLYDARWLAKVKKGPDFIDIIWDTVNNICRVDNSWFERAPEGEYAGHKVRFIPPEELLWCKIYVQNRERYDGSDVNHLILRYGEKMDWKHILHRMDPHWHLLLAQLLSFQFCYPSDHRAIVPQWLFDELLDRARQQYDIPSSFEKVCRGPIIDQTQYEVDIKEWNYKVTTIKTV
jgi:hypothetical protein